MKYFVQFEKLRNNAHNNSLAKNMDVAKPKLLKYAEEKKNTEETNIDKY